MVPSQTVSSLDFQSALWVGGVALCQSMRWTLSSFTRSTTPIPGGPMSSSVGQMTTAVTLSSPLSSPTKTLSA
jgi:hypothetical protein